MRYSHKNVAHDMYSINICWKKKRIEIWDKKLHEYHYLNYGMGPKNLDPAPFKIWRLYQLGGTDCFLYIVQETIGSQ